MSFFEKNLAVLKEKNQELASEAANAETSEEEEVTLSKSRFPILKIRDIHLHSRYDPVKDAKNWVEKYRKDIDTSLPVIVLGLGLGYHLKELLKLIHEGTEIIVVEPRIGVLRKAMEHIDMKEIINRTELLVGEDIDKIFLKGSLKHLKDGDVTIVNHNPSFKANQDYFEEFLGQIEAYSLSSQVKLKILVVSPIYGGSYPIAKYSVQALKNLGHDVEILDNSFYYQTFKSLDGLSQDETRTSHLKSIYIRLMSEALLTRVEETRPDLVFALAQSPLSMDLPERLRELNIPLAYWFVEDFREMTYWKNIAPLCDFFFTIQKGEFFKELNKNGVRNCFYLPLGCDPDVHKRVVLTEEEKAKYGSDISFVGAGYYNRRESFQRLLDFDLKIWGTEWDFISPLRKCVQESGRRLEPDEYNKIFNASRININLHSSTYHKGVNPFGDFVNPRTFEIASSGGFQLVDERTEISRFFMDGEEIVSFRDIDDLREKISYYLEHPEERDKIAENGLERVRREHTYENRMKEMIACLLQRMPERFLKESLEEKKNSVARLIEEAGRETALGVYLLQFEDRKEIDIESIQEAIKKGEGDLSEVENIFLLMSSFAA